MSKQVTFRNRRTGERLTILADFAQAASPIRARWNNEDDEAITTPYQVADARHRARLALRLVVRWFDAR